jgi:lipoyl-dependent peroxiredoxin
MSDKVLYTGKTHTSGRKDGASRSADGFLDVKLPEPHPAAENLFGAAWSACYIGALELSAQQKKVRLPASPEVDAEIDLLRGDGGFYLRARFNVRIPGIDRATAEELTELAHEVCPYSKAVHGNVAIETKVVDAEAVAA